MNERTAKILVTGGIIISGIVMAGKIILAKINKKEENDSNIDIYVD